ncbi:MAG: hypothetical protein K2Q32_07370 [Alphaproteobacteria bacterium]|nr:hypothetical protein [Alphaproteobacteria bacterium]
MNRFKVALSCVLLLLCLVLPQQLYANQQGFGVPKVSAYPTAKGVSRIGKVTGDNCRSDNDCMVGCTSGQPDDLKCLTQNEASNECVSPDAAPKSDYPCACLPDVMRCGFTFSKAKFEEPQERFMEPEPTKPHAIKKLHHKKAPHKTTHHRKREKPAVITAAPTPITSEPAHDSGQ